MSFSNYFRSVTSRIDRKIGAGLSAHDLEVNGHSKDIGTKYMSRHGHMVNRRGFLGTLAAVSTLLLPGGRVAVAGPGTSQAVILCRCFIAGFEFHQGPAMLPRLAAGQRLVLKREPANSYDSLAIAVHAASGSKIGYLPRRLNEIPSTLMDSGHPLKVVIAGVARNAPLWEMVEVEIHLG